MSPRFKYGCTSCTYEVNVVGGISFTLREGRDTMVCRSCKSIVDTLIRTIDGGDWGDRRSTLEQLFTCPLCGSEDLDHWPRSHPCPRCDGSMKEIRGKVYWD